MGIDCRNGQRWTSNFWHLERRYGNFDMYRYLPCRHVVQILRVLIELLVRDGCDAEPPPPVKPLPDPNDVNWGWTMVSKRSLVYSRRKDPSIHARARRVRQLRGLPFNCPFVPTMRYKSMYKTIACRAITHQSLAYRLWRRYRLHLTAALKCNSADCDCWEEDINNETEDYDFSLIDKFNTWMEQRDATFVMDTIYG